MPAAENLKKYKHCLCDFLSFRDDVVYGCDEDFEYEVLNSITPKECVHWLSLKAFGKPEASNDDVPTMGRSSSLFFYKKAISYFIPNKHMGYNVETKTGNPTKSPLVNDLIKRVKSTKSERKGNHQEQDEI